MFWWNKFWSWKISLNSTRWRRIQKVDFLKMHAQLLIEGKRFGRTINFRKLSLSLQWWRFTNALLAHWSGGPKPKITWFQNCWEAELCGINTNAWACLDGITWVLGCYVSCTAVLGSFSPSGWKNDAASKFYYSMHSNQGDGLSCYNMILRVKFELG